MCDKWCYELSYDFRYEFYNTSRLGCGGDVKTRASIMHAFSRVKTWTKEMKQSLHKVCYP